LIFITLLLLLLLLLLLPLPFPYALALFQILLHALLQRALLLQDVLLLLLHMLLQGPQFSFLQLPNLLLHGLD